MTRLKAAVNDGLQCDLDRGLQIEAALFAQLYGTEDQQEAMNAFLEKRAKEICWKIKCLIKK